MSARVSVGMPVFNGENHMAAALDSLLAQTFDDFEIIISDNASTDRTAEIARSYAAKDGRILYRRNAHNVGAARNFDITFELARGAYFKWAAHDDLLAPGYLARLVEALDGDTGAVLASPRAKTVDGHGRFIDEPYSVRLRTDALDPATRYREIVRSPEGHRCYEVFGLIRSERLARTNLMSNCPHGDGVLLAHLALLGRFVEVPEPLFFPRQHPQQANSTMTSRYMWAQWFDPDRRGRIIFPYWRILWEYGRAAACVKLPVAQRLRCYAGLARESLRLRRRLAAELVVAAGAAWERIRGVEVPQEAGRPGEHWGGSTQGRDRPCCSRGGHSSH